MSNFAGFSSMTKAFIGPALATSIAMTQQYSQNRFAPAIPPPLPPEEPMKYLPAPGPYATGATWAETMGTFASMAEMTGLFLGIGAVLGLTASLCSGIGREKGESSPEPPPPDDEEVSSEESDSIDNMAEWVAKNYDKNTDEEEEKEVEGTQPAETDVK
jgi:hypothetical protein